MDSRIEVFQSHACARERVRRDKPPLLALFAQDAGILTFYLVTINGRAGVLALRDGRPMMALSFETDGVRILAGYNVANPEKLARIALPNE